jgi:predicted ribosome quality control (RQC) complex YloA/Tae2 family protein
MKVLNQVELSLILQDIESLCGARLQSVYLKESAFLLELYAAGRTKYLMIDLSPGLPMTMLTHEPPWVLKSHTVKPTLLFMRSHFIGKRIEQIKPIKGYGRAFQIIFSEGHELQVRLFPRGINFILSTPDKKVSWLPVKALERSEAEGVDYKARTLEEIKSEYLSQVLKKPGKVNLEALKEQKIRKLNSAISKIKAEIIDKGAEPWTEIGHKLRLAQNLNIDVALRKHLDHSQSFGWNLNNIYCKAKKQREKLDGLAARLNVLIKELKAVECGELILKNKHQGAKRAEVPEGAWDGKRVELSSGHILLIGRKGRENLKLLRLAKAWDYWLHLKDYPGAHAILKRNKNETINNEVFKSAINALLKENFRAKKEKHIGVAYDVLVVEVRFVKPIKGDRLGRVNYSNERVMRVPFL